MNPNEAIVTVLVVGMCVGLPMLALTTRFALKPVLETLLELRRLQPRGATEELELLRARVAALEAVWEHRLGGGTLEPGAGSMVRERSRS